MTRSTEKILLWIIRLCSGAVLLLPLVVSRSVLFPFAFPKIIFFQIIVEIAATCWLLLMLYLPTYRPRWRHPLVFSLSAFIAVMVMTTLTAFDPLLAWWSSSERMTGVFAYLHFWLWFLVMIKTFKTWEEWRVLSLFSLGVSVVVVLYGMSGLAPTPWKWLFTTSLGNPTYVGVYATLHLILSAFFLLRERHKAILIFGGISFVFNAGAMLAAGSRGVLLSLLAALFVYALFSLWTTSSRIIRFWVCGGIVFCALLIVFSVGFFLTPAGRGLGDGILPLTVKRTLYMFDLENENNQERITLWTIGLKGFLERPILGWGWGNYPYIYEKYLIPRPVMGMWADRSHNQVIDVLAFTGVVGLIAYIMLWGLVFFVIATQARRQAAERDRIAWHILGSFFLFYFLQNLTAFDSPAPLFIFFFSLALVYFLATRQHYCEESCARWVLPQFFPIFPLLFLFGIPLVLSIYFYSILPFTKAVQFVHALPQKQRASLNVQGIIDSFDVRVFPNYENAAALSSLILKNNYQFDYSQTENRRLILFLIQELERYLEEHPSSVQARVFVGGMYLRVAEYDRSVIEKGEMVLKKALTFSPRRSKIYSLLGQFALIRKDAEAAISYTYQALALGSDSEKGSLHFERARAFMLAKDFDGAFRELSIAEELGYDIYAGTLFSFLLIQAISAETKDSRVIEYVDKAAQVHPDFIYHRAVRAVVYEMVGQKEKARELLKEIESVDSRVLRVVREQFRNER